MYVHTIRIREGGGDLKGGNLDKSRRGASKEKRNL